MLLVLFTLKKNGDIIHCHHIHPSKAHNSVVFSVFTKLCNHHRYLIPEHAITPQRSPISMSSHSSSPLPLSLATTNLLFVSIGVSVLDTSYKWNPTICGLLSLASFNQHVFKFVERFPCCSTHQYHHFIPSYGRTISSCMAIVLSFIHSRVHNSMLLSAVDIRVVSTSGGL